MTNTYEIRTRRKIYFIFCNINIFFQTIIFYNTFDKLPYDEYYDVIRLMLYMLYAYNFITLCTINKAVIKNYIYLCIIFNIYYIILSICYKIYLSSMTYILIYNCWNTMYLHKYRILDIDNRNNKINIEENNTESNENEIEIEDDISTDSSKSSDEDTYYSDNFDHIVDIKDKTKNECIICFINYKNNNMITTKCNHSFHKKCLLKWLKIDNICPVCRTKNPLS